jgi:hypothetical protein
MVTVCFVVVWKSRGDHNWTGRKVDCVTGHVTFVRVAIRLMVRFVQCQQKQIGLKINFQLQIFKSVYLHNSTQKLVNADKPSGFKPLLLSRLGQSCQFIPPFQTPLIRAFWDVRLDRR